MQIASVAFDWTLLLTLATSIFCESLSVLFSYTVYMVVSAAIFIMH